MIARGGPFVRVSVAGIIKPDERAREIIRCLVGAERQLGRRPSKVMIDHDLMVDLDLLDLAGLHVVRATRGRADKLTVDLWAEQVRAEVQGAPARLEARLVQARLL